jgi:hypothetical protein
MGALYQTWSLRDHRPTESDLRMSRPMASGGREWRRGHGVVEGQSGHCDRSSSGIGRAIAERLAQDGATVVVTYHVHEEKAREVAAGIQGQWRGRCRHQADMSPGGGRATPGAGDGTPVPSPRYSSQQCGGRFIPKKLVETTETEFDAILALNAKGPYFCDAGGGEGAQRRWAYCEYFVGAHPPEVSRRHGARWGARRRWSSTARGSRRNWRHAALPSIPCCRALPIPVC